MDRHPKHPTVEATSSWKGCWKLAALLTGAVALGCAHPAAPPAAPPPEVEVTPAVSRDVQDTDEFTGRVEALFSVDLRARVTGYLTEAPFKQGADVEKGAHLFKIDPRPYQVALAQAKASVAEGSAKVKAAEFNVEAAKTQLDVANDTYNRDVRSPNATTPQDLTKDKNAALMAESNLKAAQSTLVAAKATVTSAQAAQEGAEVNMEFTDVLAPFDGRISRRNIDVGNIVQADTTMLATIVSLDPIYAYFDIDERTLLRLRRLVEEGKIARSTRGDFNLPVYLGLADETGFTFSADDVKRQADQRKTLSSEEIDKLPPIQKGEPRHAGVVKFSGNQEDAQTGTLRAWGEFPNPGKILAPGMFARIELPIGQKHPAVLVPEAALVADQGRKLVYVVKDAVDDKTGEVVKNDKGEPVRETLARYVEIGSYQNGMRVITDNLAAGEIVVVSGLQRVRDKTKVREKAVQPPKSGAPNVAATVTNERGGVK
jgi:RND family efflux transporter MFP subunit